MKTTDYIILVLAGGIIFGAIFLFSKPRVRTIDPQYENIGSGIDIARQFGIM